jgi:nicotinate-nucleotide pyrophosphorylase
MIKADKIRYILKYQKDIDAELMDNFETYTKKELEEMSAREVTTIMLDLMEAEDIMDNIYQTETIRHGRSE